ncbi:LysR family transcriptional regulator [Cricetibacter osteomyelitidis]|uniref:LysR family transcriptional regulator n=1 Tax=Cricetibacter osteomyelitidis TaxID=1521931 RepID=A0A4R2SYE6_9PAST|nr:LysR family transcriptional regulator [Cricetibacter osteomyelitidis]TCP94700.1 LysR family transcriptional regulator [Cricetibacter osteomyelitidis]
MDKLNAISVFCRVVETQSFTKAAENQGISVAMASKLISQLEDQLKTRLLHRTTRKITPTETGQLYYQRCQPILAELEEADLSINETTNELQGTLMISIPRDFGIRFISPNLSRFIQSHPNLHVRIEFNDNKVDLVAEGFDLALRIGTLAENTMVGRKIASSNIHIVASPDYLKERGVPKTPYDLQHHDCLLYDSIGDQIWLFNKDNHTYDVKVSPKFSCNSGISLVDLAKEGLGIIRVPSFLVEEELQAGSLVEILSEYKQDTIDLNFVYPHRRYLPTKVKEFMRFIEELKQQYGYQ